MSVPKPPDHAKVKRAGDGQACSNTNKSAPTPSITAAPKPSCASDGQDANEGVTQAYCMCDGSIMTSQLGSDEKHTYPCAYTA